jgi:hypothetical protein
MLPRPRFTSHQSKKFVEKRQTRTIASVAMTAFCIAVWLFSAVRLTHLNALTIDSVEIRGADKEIEDSIRAAAMEAINGSCLGLFPRSNVIIYPSSRIREAVENSAARIADVKVRDDNARTLSIEVSQKEPAAIICAGFPTFGATESAGTGGVGVSGGDANNADSDNCFFADSDGLIIKNAPQISGNVFKKYFIPNLAESASSTLVGTYATSTAKFRQLQNFYSELEIASLNPAAILIKSGGEYELYIHNQSSSTALANSGTADSDLAVIYFNDHRSFKEQLSNLIAFWNKMNVNARTTGKKLPFEYIDIRYGSNIFYRLVEGN